MKKVIKLKNLDFHDLVETQAILAIETVKMAAKRRTIDDIITLKNALAAYETKIKKGLPAETENLWFHLKIADAAGNTVLKSLILIIAAKLLETCNKQYPTNQKVNYPLKSLAEHQLILDYIINQQSDLAALAMKEHLKYHL